jgi:hypothetical protein
MATPLLAQSGIGGGSGLVITTAPISSGNAKTGNVVSVTNGSSATDCTVGGGTTVVVCVYSGTSWSALGSGGASPSSLTTFFNGYFGLAPDDCGNVGCTTPVSPAIRSVKWCYDGSSSGGTNFTSTKTMTITNTVLTSGVATITAANSLAAGNVVTISGSTNGSGIFNTANWPAAAFTQTNGLVLSASGSSFTIAINSGNVGSAVDTGTVTANCANFVAADVGSRIAIIGAGAAGATLITTIASVTNATTIVLGNSITPGSLTNVKFWYGTNANTAVQNWCNNMQNAPLTGRSASGYFPGKFYYITQPCAIINPLGATGFSPVNIGGPEPFNLANAAQAISVWGQGALSSGLVVDGAFNFNCAAVGANPMGVFYYKNWNGVNLMNWAIIGDQTAAINLTGCTSANGLGGLVEDNDAHDTDSGIEVTGLHGNESITQSFSAHVVNVCFEAHYYNFTLYANDENADYFGTSDSCTFDNMAYEGFISTTGNGNVNLNQTGPLYTGNLTRITNSYIVGQPAGSCLVSSCDGIAGAWEIAFGAPYNMDMVFENDLISAVTANNLGTVWNSAARGRTTFSNVTFRNGASANTSTNLINNASTGNSIIAEGGQFGCVGTCANGIVNTSGSSIMLLGTQVGTVGISGSGSGAVFVAKDVGSGQLSGQGTMLQTALWSNQGSALATITLGAGWGTSATATPCTTRTGFANKSCFVITSGSASFSAAPTLTVTLPTALPSTATVCELNVHAITGAGGEIIFDQTGLSTTAPVFTATTNTGGAFTPAASETYTAVLSCGP